MTRSRDWPPIERLPKPPGVVEMTGTGYVINGQAVRTMPRTHAPMIDDRGLLAKLVAAVKGQPQ